MSAPSIFPKAVAIGISNPEQQNVKKFISFTSVMQILETIIAPHRITDAIMKGSPLFWMSEASLRSSFKLAVQSFIIIVVITFSSCLCDMGSDPLSRFHICYGYILSGAFYMYNSSATKRYACPYQDAGILFIEIIVGYKSPERTG